MKAFLIDEGALTRTQEAIQDAMTELELLEHDYDWFSSDSLEKLRDSYMEIDVALNNTMEDLNDES